jgi:polysaccharide pyruvyl transferase WcaK-like protein
MRNEILLITRIRTLNKGNQALSAAWLEAIRQAFPGGAVRVLERRPQHLAQFTLTGLARHRDPIARFESICAELARLAPGPSRVAAPSPARILLDETITPPARLVELRQRINLRGIAARLGRYREEFRQRLAAMQRAELVVLNPAGEFYPREPRAAYFYLLEARVGQLLGARVAMVNHTLDIADPLLRKLITHVYPSLELVGFRDEKSVGAYREMGGGLHNVLVTPDLALTTRPPRSPQRRPGTIGIAVNVPEAAAGGYLEGWRDLIRGAVARGNAVELVSNEVPADVGFYDEMRRIAPKVRVSGAGLEFEPYAALLGGYDVVVSSRMHTAILAMVAGAPVVPVEGASFKITGLFHELGLPTGVIQPGTPGWADQVLARLDDAKASRDALSAEVTHKVAAARERILSALVPRLRGSVENQPRAEAQ